MRALLIVVLFLLFCLVPTQSLGAGSPEPVSPGAVDTLARVGSGCPSFSWGGVESARRYEIVVYRVDKGAHGREPLLRQDIPGSALSWTPPLGRCLEPGGRYAWSVRAARSNDTVSEWAAAHLFEVVAVPTADEVRRAVETLSAYLGALGAAGRERASAVDPPARRLATQPGPAGDPAPRALAAPAETALRAAALATSGVVFGAHGISPSTGDGSVGVAGESTGTSGDTAGVYGQAASASGSAGVFDNTAAGDILRGLAGGVEVFTVDGAGGVTAATYAGDGSALTGVPPAAHSHDGSDVSSGTVAEPRIDAAIARDVEVAASVAAAAHVDESGDTMTGTLNLPADGLIVGATQLALSGGNLGIGAVPAGAATDPILHVRRTLSGAHLIARVENLGNNSAAALGVKTPAAGSDWALVAQENSGGTARGFELQNPSFVVAPLSVDAGTGNVGVNKLGATERLEVAGNVKATQFIGDGSMLTSVPAAAHTHDGGDVTSGTVAEPRIDASIARDAEVTTAVGAAGHVEKAGDTMTGTLNLPADGLAAGTDQLVLSGGHVGIGLTAPTEPLHVAESGPQLVLEDTASGADRHIAQFGISGGEVTIAANHIPVAATSLGMKLQVRNAGSHLDALKILPTGEVGIGIANPTGNLHVSGPGAQLYIEDSTSGTDRDVAQLFMENDTLRLAANHFDAGATPTMAINLETRNAGAPLTAVKILGDGRVGIGDTTPTNRLDVAGDVAVGAESETLANAGFTLDGDDLFVAGDAGVEGTLYTDTGVTVGASTTYADGAITQSTAGAALAIDVAGGDADGEDFVVTADNVSIDAAGAVTAASFSGDGSSLTSVSDDTRVAKAGDTMTGALNLPGDGLAVGGSQLRLSGGNLGIGIVPPGGAGDPILNVSRSLGGAHLVAKIENTGAFSAAGLRLKTPAAGSDWTLAAQETGAGVARGLEVQHAGFAVPPLSIDAGTGFVGIGKLAPGKPLQVVGPGAVFNMPDVASPITTPFFNIETDVFSSTTGILSVLDRRQQTVASKTPILLVQNTHGATVATNPLLEARAAGTTRLLLQQDGNLGLHTGSPSHPFHLKKQLGGAHLIASVENTGSASAAAVQVKTQAAGNEWALVAQDSGAGVARGFEVQNPSFGTAPLSIAASTGRVGVNNLTPADQLDVKGDVRVGTGTTGCVKDADGTVIAGTCSSDARLKKNIQSLSGLLPRMELLRPVRFEWRADEYPELALGTEMQIGLIAQEVERVLPQLVVEDAAGLKRIRYHDLPVLLLQAIKEQRVEAEALRSEMSRLQARLAVLER